MPGPVTPFQRRWTLFIDAVTFVWLGVFLTVMLHLDYPVLTLVDPATVALLDQVLFAMTVLFITDLALQYVWSDLGPLAFLRARWFDVLMAIPFLRPLRGLRILRVGRLAMIFRVVGQGQKAISLTKKTKRLLRGLRRNKAPAAMATDNPE